MRVLLRLPLGQRSQQLLPMAVGFTLQLCNCSYQPAQMDPPDTGLASVYNQCGHEPSRRRLAEIDSELESLKKRELGRQSVAEQLVVLQKQEASRKAKYEKAAEATERSRARMRREGRTFDWGRDERRSGPAARGTRLAR